MRPGIQQWCYNRDSVKIRIPADNRNREIPLFMLDKGANCYESMNLLHGANLRPLKYQEIAPLLMKDKALRDALKGKWFWLAGEGLDKKARLYGLGKGGELVEITRETSLPEGRISTCNGRGPSGVPCLL